MKHRLTSVVLVLAMVISVFATAFPVIVPPAVAMAFPEESRSLSSTAPVVSAVALSPTAATPIWQDTSYSFEERAADLVSRLTPAQRAAQMVSSQANAGVPITVNGQLIAAYGWWNEALHGISREQLNSSGNATTLMNTTSYPINQAVAASWDPELVYREAVQISDETREVVRNNKLDLDMYSPTINMARDPRWGRNDESYGEDPLLTAALASQFVNGMEGKDMNGNLLSAGNGFYKTLTTLKHYAANNSEVNRLNGVSTFDERAAREYYTAQFRKIIQQSHPGSFMSSYNRVSVAPDAAYGTPAAISTYLMDTLARQTFGFNGYVTSDCDALAIAPSRHLWVPPGPLWPAPIFTHTVTLGEIFSFGLSAGEDLECNAGYTAGGNYRTYGPSSVGMHVTTPSGMATLNDIDTSLLRLLTARMKLGEFDPEANVPWIIQARTRVPPGTWVNNNSNNAVTETPDRLALAREAGDKSIVLLKNSVTLRKDGSLGKLLPIQVPVTGTFRVLVIGTLGNIPNFYLGGYSSNQGAAGLAKHVTPYSGTLAAIQSINPGATVDFLRGFTTASTGASSLTTATVSITDVNSAANYDYVIVYVGTDNTTADEAGDRANLTLPGSGGQAALIDQVASKNPNTIVFMETIGPVDVTSFEPETSAILWSSYLAQRKGEAIADVLLGTYNPSGRTPSIWYPGNGSNTAMLPPITDYTLRPAPGIPGRTYMYYTGTLSYPFGYGLSYTDFSYGNLQISNQTLDANDSFQVSADITNTGTISGAEVVELYVNTPDANPALQRPTKRLEGFQKITLAPGETKSVTFTIKVPDLAFYDQIAGKWAVDNGRYGIQISRSSADADIQLQDYIQVTGSLTPLPTVITVKPSAQGDAAQGISSRVIFPEGMVVVPNVTVAMSDDTLYGFIEPGSSKPFPAGMTFDYISNRPGVVSVDGGGTLHTVAAGVATITATVTYHSVSQSTTFVVRVLPSLSGITVAGTAISPFSPSQNNYDLIVPDSTITVPVVSAAATNPASVLTVTQAITLPGLATVVVVGDEGLPVTYTVALAFSGKSDDFSSTTLGPQWTWVRPAITNTSLITNPGFLTINTQTGDLNTTTNTAKNILLQSANGDWTIESKLVFSRRPAANTEQGGIIAYQDDNNYLKVGWEYSTSATRFNVTLEDSLSSNVLAQTLTTLPANTIVPTTTNTVWFRMSKRDAIYRIYYSVDGSTFTPLWTTGATLSPVKVGLFAYNRTGISNTLNVAFDYFNVTNNGAPTVNAGPNAVIDPGATYNSSGFFTDPDLVDSWTGTVDYGDGSGPQALTLNPDKTFALSHLYAASGLYTVTVTVSDDSGGVGTDTALVAVNVPTLTSLISSSPNPSIYGQAALFTATVTVSGTSAVTPTGTITFYDNGTPMGTGNLDGDGQATLSYALLTGGTHYFITAVYNGDLNFRSSTSDFYTHVVDRADSAISLISAPNPSIYGQGVLTATVVLSGTGPVTPTGTVTFFDNSTVLGTSNLNVNGQATFSLATLAVGTHNAITATYGGNGNFINSTSDAYTHVVNQATTTTTLTSGPNPSVFGQRVTFTATLSGAGGGVPTGSVVFFDNGTVLGTRTVANGRATITTTALAVGVHTPITATYGGDANLIGSTSNAYTQTVNRANTTTSLTSVPNPSIFGQTVTFTATVAASAPGVGVPTGSVAFFESGTSLGLSSLDVNGRAALSLASLAAGVHNLITATYSGDTNFAGSTSNAYTQTVKQPTTTSLTSTPNPSIFGQAVTFTATVTISDTGTPTGTVTFFDAGSPIGVGNLTASGQATITIASLAIGTHAAITATYSGDMNFAGSTSSAYTQVVNQIGTTISVASSPNPSTFGQEVTFTATVAISGAGTPTGTVTFFDNGASLGAGSLDVNGQATIMTTSLTVGTHTAITATYSGDMNFAGSVSDAYTHIVDQASTATSVTSSPNPAIFGQTVIFTATVGINAPGAGTPTGVLTLTIDSIPVTQTVAASGVVTYSTSTLAVGVHSVTATYCGDANFSGSSQMLVGGQVVTDTAISGLAAVNSGPTHLTNATFFTATISSGSNVSYQWNFGDGQIGSGAMTTHTYTMAGTYTAIVTATNSSDSRTAATTVYVTDLPIAEAGPNQTVRTGSLVLLDGSASSDPGSFLPLTYHWEQLDGTPVTLSNPNNVTVTFTAPTGALSRSLIFGLTVTNTQGIASLRDSIIIVIEPYRIMLPLVLR